MNMNKVASFYYLIYIYFLLVFFEFELRKKGFHKLYPRYVKAYSKQAPLINEGNYHPNNVSKINSILILIDKACAMCPFKAECLHRSFIGFRLIRQKFRVPANLVIGVKKFPFSSHAWLMIGNENMNESFEYTSQFIIIMDSGKGY